ncbi:MAG: ATP-dependent 6-phosphofructokinase [Candidatus Aureabacteria bacterium]|nr:ATP-dependent 6-phosphofructokinase [Candidatus Auribacterota bacterium]
MKESFDLNFDIKRLGKPITSSPLKNIHFVSDDEKILFDINYKNVLNHSKQNSCGDMVALEKAGPRELIYFQPEKVIAGIVTCGGLCPGLNNVIRSLVMQLHYQYKVKKIMGFRYGYRGLFSHSNESPLYLTVEDVEDIHYFGGSMLGCSRGSSDTVKIVDGLEHYGVNVLFTIGGDGTIKGSIDIEEEVRKRELDIAVVNIPKTIDNDIPYISRSFGFQTAFSEAVESIRCAHNEAIGAPNGIGIVKVMGRSSGFIAAQTTLAQKDVNYVLVPEIDFDLDGEHGLLSELEQRLKRAKHALIVVAEGAGQKFFEQQDTKYDLSGNKRLDDIGVYLKERIKASFANKKIEVNVKYIDPSYIIRSVPANPEDGVYCGFLAEHAVHAAMSGRTRMVIGRWNENFVNLPMDIIKAGRKKLDPNSSLWQSVLLSTGQPPLKA